MGVGGGGGVGGGIQDSSRGGGNLLVGFTVRNEGKVFMELQGGGGGINLHGTVMS